MPTFALKLDDYALRKLTEAARKAGVTPERMAAETLEAWILDGDELDRSPAGVGEPGHPFTDVTKNGNPGRPTTPEDDEGPFVDLHVALDALSAARIAARATRMGIAPEELATIALDSRFFDVDDFTWINGNPRTRSESPSDLEGARDWDEVRPELEAYLEEQLKARR